MRSYAWIFAALCCLTVAQVGTSSADVMENLAEIVCRTKTGTKYQFSSVASISQLADYMSGLAPSHKLYECRAKHLESLKQLVHTIKSNNDDVCGEQKIALIEDYHRKYVTKVSKHLRLRRKDDKAPKMAKLYFMQYVTEISSQCEQAALKAIEDNKHPLNAEQLTNLEKLRKFTDALGMSDLSKGYKGIYLFWNMVDSLSIAHSDKMAKYLSEGEVRAHLQMHDARKLNGVQAICRHQLKPVYAKSMLPVLRLVDMGYYPRSKKLAESISSDPNAKSLFLAAQICETILPVAVYSDEQLSKDQFVAITREEASKLSLPTIPGSDELIKNRPIVSVAPVSVDADNLKFDNAAVKAIKKDVKSRGKVMSHLLKHMAKQLRNKFKKAFSNLKLFRKTSAKQLEPVDESLDKLERLEISEEADNGAMRRRRSAWETIKGLTSDLGYVVYYALLTTFKLIFFSVPMIITGIVGSFGVESAQKAFYWLLNFGESVMDDDDGDLASFSDIPKDDDEVPQAQAATNQAAVEPTEDKKDSAKNDDDDDDDSVSDSSSDSDGDDAEIGNYEAAGAYASGVI